MSVTMSKAEGVTVLTLTSDPQGVCPPLCQILSSLCYSPVCCTVSQHLRRIRTGSMNVLGTLQIMIGLVSIGLAVILTCSRSGSGWRMDETAFPYWMGALFILFGILCILSERFPSPCLVIFNMVLHVVAVGMAIAAIVLYSINMGEMRLWWMCNYNDDYYYYRRRTTTSSPSEVDKLLKEKCYEGRELILMLLRSINAVLIVLSVLELCVVISVFVMGVKTLRSRVEKPAQGAAEPEYYKPLLEDDAKQLSV